MGAAAIGASVLGTGLGVMGDLESAKATSKYYNYLSAISMQNANLVEAAGKAESAQLGTEAFGQMQQLGERKSQTIGAQKAALSTGAGVGSKTAEQIVSDTYNKFNMDEEVLRYNTDLKIKNVQNKARGEAMGYRSQAGAYELAAKNAKTEGKWKAASTILGGASSTAYMGKQLKVF